MEISSSASKVKLFNAVSSQLLGASVDVSLRENHGEASQVNVVESRSVTDELRLLELQIKLKEAEAIARRVGIRQAKTEAKEAEAKAKESDSENLRLRIQLGQRIANVSCVHELPVAGVDLILGNDLAGGQMGNVTPPPVLLEKPESTAELQQFEDDMPGVSPLCDVTRSMSMTKDHNVTPVVDDSLSLEGLFANPIASQDISSAVNAVTGRVALIAAQE
ncbi:hypothetical protein Hamer_G025028 [Homarus americanus]|uniref:Uncharacterized protein n=1 Tax=Homarus americanus TaxID=6706 RepID=A0A8J5N5D8_HOMAM|nr:hypothetical protein Hamer_G025028 [Homarus americanus]